MPDVAQALEAIGKLPDSEIDLAGAAIQLARATDPGADWHSAMAHLSDLARGAAAYAAQLESARLPIKAHALRRLLVDENGYAGDTLTYDDLSNANLIHVTERRLGLPVALGILWIHAAHAAGWDAHGLDFPGHFLIGLQGKHVQLVVDPFEGGGTLDAADLQALLRQVEGPDSQLRPGLLRPMSRRAVLLRLQNNIRTRHLAAGRLREALAATETMLAIAPEDARLLRDVAELRGRLN